MRTFVSFYLLFLLVSPVEALSQEEEEEMMPMVSDRYTISKSTTKISGAKVNSLLAHELTHVYQNKPSGLMEEEGIFCKKATQ